MSNQHRHAFRYLYNWDDNDHENTPSPFIVLINEHTVIFIWFIVASIFALVLASVFAVRTLKTYLRQRWGIICCDCGRERAQWTRSRDAAIATSQLRRNAAISAQRQKEIDDEERRKALERSKRILGEVSLTVEADHLEREEQDLQALEAGLCSEERDSAVVLNIPGLRRTEGHCAICIAEYSPGDKVVWSPNDECRHVFHEDCILLWLGKDKKDCPCCRMPFIPEKEEMDEENEEKREAASSASTSETQASSDTDGSESSFGSEEEPVPSFTSSSSNQAQQHEA